jgi:hypothetical protein
VDETQAPSSALAPSEVALHVQRQASAGVVWTRRRKKRFSRAASAIRVLSLALAVTSTVILGLQNLNSWASVAFSLVAIGTLVNALEPFFKWRSRWVLMEEAQYRFHEIQDELDYFLCKTPACEVKIADLDPFFERLQEVWKLTSERWLEYRRSGEPGSG